MSSYLEEFRPPHRILMGPGPSSVHPRVLQTMSAPVLGHLDPYFVGVMDDVMEMLKMMFHTSNPLTLPVSGTGSAGVEAAFCNVVEQGDIVIVVVNGHFGNRAADTASRVGGDVRKVELNWGDAIGPDLTPLEDELKKHNKVKAVSVVHGETSTGVLNPLPEIAKLVHRYDALLIVDAVTSLGGELVDMDEWDLDVCHSCTQKCIGAPPGLAPISLGPRAVKVMQERQSQVQSFYLNLSTLQTYWGDRHQYHHTAPISMIYALREALRMAMEEGLDNRLARHARVAAGLRAGLTALGMDLFANPTYRLNPLTTAVVPEGVDQAKVRGRLLNDYNIEIAGGLGQIASHVWRIGVMGGSAEESNVLALLSAMERILPEEGYEVAYGAGVAAAQQAFAAAA